jgi:UDP:flavonoid glycosyltransferase YjiC (YdhE family)
MRVLVTCVPALGHFSPLVPLLEALIAQGDEVVIATGVDPGGAVARLGAEHRVAGHAEDHWFATLVGRSRGDPGDGLRPERINHYFLPRLFGEIATADMADDVVSIGRETQPDLVLAETYALAGPVAAAVLGVPLVHHLIGPLVPHEVMELVNDAVTPLWRSFGLESPRWGGVYSGVTIQISPPSFEVLSLPEGEGIALRPAPLPVRRPAPTDPPTIYVTLGTFFGGNSAVFRAVLDGLADEPVQVVATVGADQDPSGLEPLPANARVQRFIPQADLLPDCSVVVHHGGAGTMFGSLAHGLPQVVIPQGADNFINGGLIGRAGVGTDIQPDELDPVRVRQDVARLLGDEGAAAAGHRLAEEFAAMPSASEVAPELRNRFGPG